MTLTGTVERIAGSDDETGTATYKAVGGASRLDLSFSSGTRSEIRGSTASGPVGTWIGVDGASHPISNHNLMSDPGWFPAFTLGNLLSSSGVVVTYVGSETRNGQSVIHLQAYQQYSARSPQFTTLLQHLSQMEIYLDATTYLPAALDFNIHPDNDAGLDIPVEIRFSDYRVVSGAQIPFHVQKYVNNGLALDLQFQTVTSNTGLSATTFQLQ